MPTTTAKTATTTPRLSQQWQEKLRRGALKLNITLTPETIAKFEAFTELLLKWNKTYNLTAIDSPDEILTLHILDSLSIAPYVKGKHILDVGSGAGFPGIPLALALPDYSFTLLDSNNKKARFLRHVALTLPLKNVNVVQERAEKLKLSPSPPHPSCFNTIATRATATIKDIILKTQHLCCPKGQWLFMKGKYPKQELQELEEIRSQRSIKPKCEGYNKFSESRQIDPSSLEFRLGGKEQAIGAYGFIRDYRLRRCQQRRKPKCEGSINFPVTIETQCLKIPEVDIERNLIVIKKEGS